MNYNVSHYYKKELVFHLTFNLGTFSPMPFASRLKPSDKPGPPIYFEQELHFMAFHYERRDGIICFTVCVVSNSFHFVFPMLSTLEPPPRTLRKNYIPRPLSIQKWECYYLGLDGRRRCITYVN
nr:hypothetical protein Q903MT_gene3225 [Picea sitchensis]